MRSLMMEVDEYYACLIEWYNLVCTRLASLEKNKPLELVLKSWK
jgi:hypothetical protein